MNQPKKYTAASNQRFILRELWHYDRSTIFFAIAEIITQIGKGFGTILIPSMIVAFLEQYQKGMITQETLPGAVAKLVTFFVGYSIWCIITGYLKRRNQFQYVKFRCGTMIECTYQKYMSLDYVQCEDEKVQQLLKKAGEAVSGNYRGIEGVLHYDVELLKEAGALILYASLISGVSAWLVVLLVVISLVQILSYKLANNYELKHRDAKAKLTVTLLRFPIAYAVALSSLLCLLTQGLPLTTICQQMVKGISSFSLMAVPFFITMGVLMGTGGISEKLIALANACVGWMTGGMAMVNIVASYFFGGISGSASADTASIGSIMIPMMVDQGYDDDFSTAVTITSSCEGLLVPPSHNMVIYAMSAGGISVGSLFLAGYLPGALLAVSLMVGSYIISKKKHYPKGDKFSFKGLLKQIGISIWALAAVVIVVIGVVAGWFTATESAAIAVFYSLIVSVYIYKGLDWKGVWKCLEQCIDTLSIVLILISTSSIFGYCLTTLHVPDMVANAIVGFSTNPIVIALLIDLILLFLGCIMDMAPIILIATPILLPIATSIGIDPVQFGIIMVLNCGIGLLTPPVGSVLFIGSAVSGVKMERVVKATLPFYICMIIVLMLLTFIPEVSLLLPRVFGGYGG